MTSKEYDNLTDELKRIKVAELDGWIISVKAPIGLDGRYPWLHPKGDPENPERYYLAYGNHNLPDYLNDLNACHELMVLVLEGDQFGNYYRHLTDTLHEKGICSSTWQIHNTTAEQRCKAFVLTMTEKEE